MAIYVVYLRPNGIFYGQLVHFVVIWHIFPRFGMFCREKSGNTGADFSYIFSGENFAENFPPKNDGKKWNFPRKKF
jgi:hypothetical protein